MRESQALSSFEVVYFSRKVERLLMSAELCNCLSAELEVKSGLYLESRAEAEGPMS